MNVGVKHFIEPEWFLQIMPPNFPHHYEAVYWSGFFELLFGFLLINPMTRQLAGWGIIFVMITVFPANLYLAVTDGEAMNICLLYTSPSPRDMTGSLMPSSA